MLLDIIKSIQGPSTINFKPIDKNTYILLTFHNDTIGVINIRYNSIDELISDKNCVGENILLNNLKNKYVDENDIFDLFDDIFNILKELTNYCSSCYKKLQIKSDRYIVCESINCQYKREELYLHDDYITDKYKNEPDVVDFLITTSLISAKCNRKDWIFEPFPTFLCNTKRNRSDFNDKNSKNLTKLGNLLNNIDQKTLINDIKKSINDDKLYDKWESDLYSLVKFILMSNRTNMRRVYMFNRPELDENIKQYEVKHLPDVESKHKGDSIFLFHGSNTENWHSILRNGLKNCSGTGLQLNGAAYGKGVYLASDYNYSCRYSRGDMFVFAVCELYNLDCKKASCIYVCNEEDVLIRYILLISKSMINKYGTDINQLYRMHSNKKKSSKRDKRVNKEMSKLNHVQIDDNIYDIIFDNYVIRIDIPGLYPMKPPFMYIKSPIVKENNHISKNGAILKKELVDIHWSPCNKICDIIKDVNIVIKKDGNNDIDLARKDINNVASSKGWYL